MKAQRFVVLGLGVITLSGGAARADLSWEHRGEVRISREKQPALKFKLFTNMTPSRSRVMFNYYINPSAMAGPMGSMSGIGGSSDEFGGMSFGAPLAIRNVVLAQMDAESPNPFMGSLALINRFDDGQFIGYASVANKFVSEPIQDMLTKYRYDPWKKLAPKLSQNEPPSLSHEQRARLGAEVRAALAPFTGRMWKTFFRQLPERRTFNGIQGTGYRLTMLMNAGSPFAIFSSDQWTRVAMEWWIADTLAGDEVVAQMREAAYKTIGPDYKSSTSMWMNETPKVMWAMLPDEIHRAAYTLVPPPDATPGSPAFQRANMPLAMYLTVTPPGNMKDRFGEVRAEMTLVRRGTDELPQRVFEAPAKYKRVPLADIIKEFEQASEGMKPPLD